MSREWEIDCRLRDLIVKVVRKTVPPEELAEIRTLQRERVSRMMPAPIRP